MATVLPCDCWGVAYSGVADTSADNGTMCRAREAPSTPLNRTEEADCTFPYYKEVMIVPGGSGPFLCVGEAFAECVDVTTWDGVTRKKRLTPVPIDCATPFKWRDSFCPADIAFPAGTDPLKNMVTEHDIMQFLWAIHARGSRSSVAEIASTIDVTCGGMGCASSRVRWAPVTPENPGTGATSSWEQGAQAYFDAVYGENSDQLRDFSGFALNHGITPDSLPAQVP